MQNACIQLNQQLNNYLAYLRDEKHSSANTIQAYRRDLGKFFDFASIRKIDSFTKLNAEDENFAEKAKNMVVESFTEILGEDHAALETLKTILALGYRIEKTE